MGLGLSRVSFLMRVPLSAARISAFIGFNEHARRERKKKNPSMRR
jgi:hypothetical protein